MQHYGIKGIFMGAALALALALPAGCSDDPPAGTADLGAGDEAGAADATPDKGGTAPDKGGTAPDRGGTTSDTGGATPDGAQPTPDQGSAKPDVASPKPDHGGAKPDAAPPAGDAGNPCAPMDAQGQGPCAAVLGITWDGTSCVYISGCSCTGADCGKLFQTMAACQKAYAPCTSTLKCTPWDTKGQGACKMILGYTWDGKSCQMLSGCSCVGADCNRLYASSAACQKGQAACAPSTKCTPWDAKGQGVCALFLGYAWDGKACQGLSGCSCVGADCKSLYSTLPACQKGQASCVPPVPPANCGAMDAKGVGLCDKHMGWAWDGKACVGVSGCSCSGKDCAKLYTSKAACQAAFAGCP